MSNSFKHKCNIRIHSCYKIGARYIYISSGAQIKIKNIIFPFDLVLIWKEDTQMTLQIYLFTHMYLPPNFPLNFSPVHQCVHLIGFLISGNPGVIKNPINLIGRYYFVTVLFVTYGSVTRNYNGLPYRRLLIERHIIYKPI